MTAGAEPSVLPKSQKGAAPVRAQGRRRKEHSRHMAVYCFRHPASPPHIPAVAPERFYRALQGQSNWRLGSLKPFSHVETDWRLTHSVSATNSCVIWQRMRFSFNASPRDLATAFFSFRTSLELTYFLSAFTIRIWKHGKKRTYVGTKVRRQHRFFVCRGLESGKKTKTIPVFYRML